MVGNPNSDWNLEGVAGPEKGPRSAQCSGLSPPPLLRSLVLLVILNMMLFYKLWMLEYTTQTLTAWQGLRLQER